MGLGGLLFATGAGLVGAGAAADDISEERVRSKTDSASGSILAGETTAVVAGIVFAGAAKEFDRKMEASCLLTLSDSEKKCVHVAIFSTVFDITN